MDIVNHFLNLAAPPFTFVSLCLFLPPFLFFKFVVSVLSSIFSEDVSGKVVLVTGASSGIGEHLAYEYAKRGACLVLSARRERSLREVADRCLELGSPDAIVVNADVSKIDDCKHIVDTAIQHFGRLDHLVNNAGVIGVSTFEDSKDITNMRPVMDINFWGSVYTTQFAIPHLRNTRGKVIVMSSSASWLPVPRESIYNASKAAMMAFFETLRVELGSDIKVTIVTPGLIESEFTKGKYFSDEAEMKVDQDLRDVQVNALPVGTVEGTAKAIVRSICRGDKYVTVPAWIKMTYLWKVFCPEMLELVYRVLFLLGTGESPYDAIGKKIVGLPGAKTILYPSGIHTPDVKTD